MNLQLNNEFAVKTKLYNNGHMDVLVLLHSLNLFIIHCIVWFLLNQSFEHSNLVEDSICSCHMILQYLIPFVSCEHLCGLFKAAC